MSLIKNLIIITALCLAVSCSRTDNAQDANAIAEIGSTAPDFALNDLTGKKQTLSSYSGKVILLEFWATWCPPCRATVPDLAGLQSKYQDKGFTVIGISIDSDQDPTAKVVQFVQSSNINYPVFIANDNTAKSYNVVSIPVSYLIDRTGKIIDIHMGYSDNFSKKISSQIEKLL